MADHILKVSRPGVFDIRCLSWNTAIIVFMKNASWIDDDIKVVNEFPCLLEHPSVSKLVQRKLLSSSFSLFVEPDNEEAPYTVEQTFDEVSF